MSLKAGIIGMPNVGKSTLFNSLTNSNVEAANYPFATIEPNHGIVKVFDERLIKLASLINPDKITPAVCHFTDIAGLVKGASKGEGLGNQFLTNIRETDAICHVIRCFKDKNITHVSSSIDPVCDCNIINTELFLSDLQTMEKKISKIKGLAKSGKPEYIEELRICEKVVSFLEKEYFISKMDFEGEKEWGIIKECNLLTIKPIIYIANIDDEDISNPENNENFNNLKKFIGEKKIIIPIAINIEYEISKLDNEEKKLFLQEMNIKISGLDYLIKTTYDTLGIQTFFTFGKSETKA
jgi:GTP-binding protein YchF